MGYGLRYEYGIFRQSIRDGYQVEQPDNWLRRPDPWEVVRPGKVYPVPLQASFELTGAAIRIIPNRPSTLLAVAYDRPVVGYGARCVNTLRLWAAAAPEHFDFAEFSQGDFVGAVIGNVAAESLTRVLYPDDSTEAGRTLRFLQQYFLVSCVAAGHRVALREGRPRQLDGAARSRRDPAQRHASRPGRRRADADPARPGPSRLGRGLGSLDPARSRTRTTPCCRKRSRSGPSISSSC